MKRVVIFFFNFNFQAFGQFIVRGLFYSISDGGFCSFIVRMVKMKNDDEVRAAPSFQGDCKY